MQRISNKIVFLVLGLALFLWGCSAGSGEETAVSPANTPAPTSPATPEPDLTLLAFGDSLTEGFGVAAEESYPSQLSRKLAADGYNIDVVNGGISGEASTAALARVEWMLGTEPDIVIVETGANDALRGVDLDLTRENINQIVEQFTASGAVVIVAGLQITQNLGEPYTTDFAAIFPTVAEKHGSILIPFVLEGVATNPDLNQPDFIHPTGEGYTVMVEHIYPFVLEAIEAAGQ
ncbi:MAG: arylesterase [Chloroflexota bacterium]